METCTILKHIWQSELCASQNTFDKLSYVPHGCEHSENNGWKICNLTAKINLPKPLRTSIAHSRTTPVTSAYNTAYHEMCNTCTQSSCMSTGNIYHGRWGQLGRRDNNIGHKCTGNNVFLHRGKSNGAPTPAISISCISGAAWEAIAIKRRSRCILICWPSVGALQACLVGSQKKGGAGAYALACEVRALQLGRTSTETHVLALQANATRRKPCCGIAYHSHPTPPKAPRRTSFHPRHCQLQWQD